MSLKDAIQGEIFSISPVIMAGIRSRVEQVIGLDTIIDSFFTNPQAVLLLHGFLMNEHSMAGLGYHLQEEGFKSYLRNYKYGDDLREVASRRSKSLTNFCKTRNQKVSLIGHSEGGLVAWEKAQNNPHLINKVIALGTPVYGSPLAHVLPIVPSCRQMCIGSDYLQDLWERGFPKEVEFHFIFSKYDEIVIRSPESTMGDEYSNVHVHIVNNVGHLGLIGPRCYKLVSTLLKS